MAQARRRHRRQTCRFGIGRAGLWLVRVMLIIGAGALLAPQAVAADPTGRRIASLNVCADQLLLKLVGRERIVALSPFADRPGMSAMVAEAEGLPRLRGTAEEVLALKADTVLTGGFASAATRQVLAAHGVRVIDVPFDTSIAGLITTLRRVGAELDVRDGAARLEAELTAALAAPAPVPTLDILPLERRGWIEGETTIYTELLAAGGFRNAGATLAGHRGGGLVPLERIVAARVPWLMVSQASVERPDDQGAGLLVHPALARLYPPERRVLTPPALMSCPIVSAPRLLAFLRATHARLIGRLPARIGER